MKKKRAGDESEIPSSNLRERAEEKMRVRPPDTVQPGDAERLVHELQVHQIELEMQNDELLRAQQELEASRARYFDLYDLAPVGYFTLSEKGLIQEVNLTAAALLGVERKALVNQPLTRFILKEDQDIYYLHRKQLFETGAPQVCEFRMLRAAAAPFWARVEAAAAKDADGLPVCRAVMSDITAEKRAEESERANAALLEIAGHTARFGGWSVNLAEKRIVWSDEVCAIHEAPPGYSPTVEGGINFYAPEWQERVAEVFTACAREGKPYDEELEIITARGRRLWVRTLGEAIRDESGTITKVQGSFQDITERKRTEEALRSSFSRQEALLAAVPDIIMEVDSHKKYTWANQAGLEFFGEDVIGKDASFFFEGEQKTYDIVVPLFNGDEQVVYLESWQRRRNGEKRLLAWWCRTLKDAQGVVTGALSTARDITDRKQAETQLHESHARYESLFEATGTATLLVEEDGTILMANGECLLTTGYSSQELLGTKWPKYVAPDSLEIMLKYHKLRREDPGKAPRKYEANLVNKKGEIRNVVLDIAMIPGTRRSVVSMLDITERKQAEGAVREARELLEAVLNSIPVRVFWKDRNLAYLGCNTPFARDAGFEKPEDLLGKDDFAMGWREQAELYRADDRAVIESGEAKLLFEEVQTTPSGERIHLLTSKLPLRDAGGAVVGVLGTYYDISTLRHAQEELHHVLSSARCILWHAVVTLPAGGGKMDWTIRISNEDAAAEMLPLSREPGQTYSDVWHSGTPREDLDRMNLVSEQALREGKRGYTQEFRCRTMNGDVRWLLEDARIEELGPDRWVVVGVCTDVTARREAEEKMQQQLEELRRWQKATLGREGRILDLKREVNELLVKEGQEARYGSAEGGSKK